MILSVVGWGLPAGCGTSAGVRQAEVATYVRTDSDQTTVVTPRTRVRGAVDQVTIEGSYGVDVWTGASIDVRTAATERVEEVRHEGAASLGLEVDDTRLTGRYRASFEPDYQSHSGGARLELDLAQRATTLALDMYGGADTVGRVGDPDFEAQAVRVGGRVSWIQVLDPETLVALDGEFRAEHGFLSSPYRFVAVGGDGTCQGAAPFCLPERAPRDRMRAAVSVRGRRALGPALSLGAGYGFYADTWELFAQRADIDLAWRPGESWTLGLGYRFYIQGEARFFRPRYFRLDDGDGYLTRDRKLSAMQSHALTLRGTFEERNGDITWTLGARSTGRWYEYLAFVGLDRVFALELSVLAGVRLH